MFQMSDIALEFCVYAVTIAIEAVIGNIIFR